MTDKENEFKGTHEEGDGRGSKTSLPIHEREKINIDGVSPLEVKRLRRNVRVLLIVATVAALLCLIWTLFLYVSFGDFVYVQNGIFLILIWFILFVFLRSYRDRRIRKIESEHVQKYEIRKMGIG